jgi:hypothetical protein
LKPWELNKPNLPLLLVPPLLEESSDLYLLLLIKLPDLKEMVLHLKLFTLKPQENMNLLKLLTLLLLDLVDMEITFPTIKLLVTLLPELK